ncbi:Os10g0504500, partial [Oryza sativa Japonica Group]
QHECFPTLKAKAGGSCFTLATRLALANLDFNILLGDEIKLDDPDGPDPDRTAGTVSLHPTPVLLQTPE